MLSGIPFDGPIGAVRIAYSQTGEWIPHPTYEEGDEQHVRARRGRSSARQRRRRHHDGRGRRHREELRLLRRRRPEGRRGRPRRRPRGLQDVDQGVASPCSASSSPASSPPRARSCRWTYTPALDYGPEVFAAVEPIATAELSQAVAIAGKAERNAATDAVAADAVAKLVRRGRRVRRPRARGQGSRPQPHQEARAQAHRRRGHAHRRSRPPRPAPAVSSEVGVLPTAHGTGLFQRGETQVMNVVTHGHAAHEPAARHARPGDQQVLPVPLQHGPVGQR